MPTVSVIITTYNRANLVGKAIESVLNQSYRDFELIIIDNSLIDDTRRVVESFGDKRLKCIHPEENLGSCDALNRGLGFANGKYIAILDDDDCWLDENKLKQQVDFLESHPEYVLVGTNIIMVDEEGVELSRSCYPEKDWEIRDEMLMRNCFAHSSVMYRTLEALSFGGYSPVGVAHYSRHPDDYDLWLKLGTVGKIANLPVFSVGYTLVKKGKVLTLALEEFNLVSKYKRDYPNYWKAVWFRCVKAPCLFAVKFLKG